ncbi:hypothetical protein [Nocardiopsis dassonvillei]|uniref:hypothetical protein n=1 Tax=Nocardiopsis dassonvillei TaxID=2014 RepID=UPI0033DBDA3C
MRTATVKENDVVVVEGLPVTTLVRTVVDLLAVHADGGHIGGVIADAEQRGLIDLQQLAERITPQAAELGFAGLDGHEVIEHLVEQAGRSLSAQIHDEQMRDVAALSSAMGAVAESLSTRFDLPYSAVVEALRESVLKQSTPGMSHLGATSELRRVRNALAHLAHTAPRMDPDLLVSLRDVLAHAVPRSDLYALAGLQGSLSSLPALRHAVLPSARPSSALASHRRAADSAHSGSYNQDGDGE